jgi:hypothetical protein
MSDANPTDREAIELLLAELAEVKAQVASLQRQVEGQDAAPSRPPEAAGPGRSGGPMSRRAMLATAAGLTATGVAVVAGATPAAAANGDALVVGQQKTGTATTSLTSTIAGGAAFIVENPSTESSSGFYARNGASSGIAASGAVIGDSAARPGVSGSSSTSTGVRGVSAAVSMTQAGVVGFATAGGIGVLGTSTTGIGVLAQSSSGTAAQISGGRADIYFSRANFRGLPTEDAYAHRFGELVRDSDGTLWYCTANGTPGTWRKVTGRDTAGSFHVLDAPARIYDSRPGSLPAVGSKTPLTSNVARTLSASVNSSGVPADATAVSVTVLLVNAFNGNGNFTMWANGAPKPAANTMVWGAGSGRYTAFAITALGTNASLQVAASAKTDVVLDVVGYYR